MRRLFTATFTRIQRRQQILTNSFTSPFNTSLYRQNTATNSFCYIRPLPQPPPISCPPHTHIWYKMASMRMFQPPLSRIQHASRFYSTMLSILKYKDASSDDSSRGDQDSQRPLARAGNLLILQQ